MTPTTPETTPETTPPVEVETTEFDIVLCLCQLALGQNREDALTKVNAFLEAARKKEAEEAEQPPLPEGEETPAGEEGALEESAPGPEGEEVQ